MARVVRKRTALGSKVFEALKNLDDQNVAVGVFESAKYEDGTPVAGVAAVQEFGSPQNGIPPRPFMRTTVDDKESDWSDIIARAAKAVMRGDETIESALEKVGIQAAGDIRKTISSITSPALSAATIKKKGSEKPLIESGILLNSITHKVGFNE